MPSCSCCASTTRRRSATSSSCSTCTRARPATWTAASSPATRSCRRWSATPARRRSARPRRRGPATSTPASTEQVASFAEAARPAGRRLPGPRRSAVAAATFGEVMCTHLQGVRRGRPDHQRRRPRPRPGRGARLPLLHQRHHLRRTATATSPHLNVPVHVGGVDDPPRRPAARRPQRRDDDPAGDRRGCGRRLRRIHGRGVGGPGLPEGGQGDAGRLRRGARRVPPPHRRAAQRLKGR